MDVAHEKAVCIMCCAYACEKPLAHAAGSPVGEGQAEHVRASSVPASLSGSVASYWKTTYIDTSNEQENEPTQEHLDVLCGFLSFLENSDENFDLISNSDWKELSELVNCEAETLPIEILQQLMSILVEKGVF